MHLYARRIFLQSAAKDFKRTGAVAPSSKALAQAMTRKLSQHYRNPAAILEVGAGTGSITEEIVPHLRRGDILDVYEIDPRFASLLRQRAREDKRFRAVKSCITIHNKAIETIERLPRYDFVISCLPLTNFEPEKVREIFETYRDVLVPSGYCSFFEYVFVRKAAQIMSGDFSGQSRTSQITRIVREYIERYSCGQELVFRNLPPAKVHHIRFGILRVPAGSDRMASG